MSYCRFSTNDFRCDLYVYDDVSGGVTIHVASNRHDIPADAYPPPVEGDDYAAEWERYWERYKVVHALIARSDRVAIGLPADGDAYFNLPYHAAAAKVRELIAMGYRCDPAVADEIEQEGQTEDAAVGDV